MRRLIGRLWVVLVIGALALGVTAIQTFRPHLPPAERGRRLAESMGCLGCHGAGGLHGAANPGRSDRTVPTFRGDLMMYAKSRADVAEWIRDGATERRRQSESWRRQRDSGTLVMPAYGARLSRPELEDLTAFVIATSEPDPDDSLAAIGLERAGALGCTGCHGAGGRFSRPNPGSLKGVIPSWDGVDFPELVRDRAEFEEWVNQGISRRFDRQPLPRWFLNRAAVKMPAFRKHLLPGDLEALWAYVSWLRGPGAARRDSILESGDAP